MSSSNVIHLRQLLGERFPHLRTRPGVLDSRSNRWATGLSLIDEPSQGGFEKGALAEIVTGNKSSCGSASLIHYLIRRAAGENRMIALIDGADSLEVTRVDSEVLLRLLWIRTVSLEKALKAADLVLRDQNLSWVLMDLAGHPARELRRISATLWYRFQRLVENTSTVCLIFTPCHVVGPARTHVNLAADFSLDALEQDSAELLSAIKINISDAHGMGWRSAEKTA